MPTALVKPETIGRRVQELREAAGFVGRGKRLREFAEECNIPRTTLLMIELGRREMTVTDLLRFCEALGRLGFPVSADVVLCRAPVE